MWNTIRIFSGMFLIAQVALLIINENARDISQMGKCFTDLRDS